MAKIPVNDMIALFEQMYTEHWSYQHGVHRTGCVDCIGSFIYAYKHFGHNLGASGTNNLARNKKSIMSGFKSYNAHTELTPGMIVLRARDPGTQGWNLPNAYRPGGSSDNGDYADYYHVGLLGRDKQTVYSAVGPKTGFGKGSINAKDSGVKTYVAYLTAVDYGSGVDTAGSAASSSSSSTGIVFMSSPLGETYTVTSTFGTRDGSAHKGIDLGVAGNPIGTVPVLAVMSGTVTVAQNSTSYGNYVDIDHGDGVVTRYAHLDSLSVSVGEKVSAGTRLGMMGDTGNSRGAHLHFELLINDTAVNPSTYLLRASSSASSSAGSTGYSSGSSGSTTVLGNSVVLYDTAQTVATRSIENLGRHPSIPYIKIYLGTNEILKTTFDKPHILQRLEFNRIEDAGSTASIVLFDDNWDQIEPLLAKNWNQIGLEFGYKDSPLKSPIYYMLLSTYNIEFNATGVILSMQAISEGAYTNMNPVSITTGSYNPTEAIRKICNNQGWTIDEDKFVATNDISRENPYNLVSEYPLTYIKSVIVPEARTDEGEIVVFNLDENNVATLSAVTWNSEAVKTYVYQKGYDSVVQSLRFNIKGIFAAGGFLNIASDMSVSNVDSAGNSYNSSANIQNTTTTATGNYMHIANGQSSLILDGAGDTKNQSSAKLYYSLKNSLNHAYEATMTIIGDPTIELLSMVRIINITDDGKLHHTSGIYMVMKISHSISGGTFLTTLQLIHNADINEGIELINPRSLIK